MYVIKSLDGTLFTLKSAHCWMPASHLCPKGDCGGLWGFDNDLQTLVVIIDALQGWREKKKKKINALENVQPHT